MTLNENSLKKEKLFIKSKIEASKKIIKQYENNSSFLGTNKGTDSLRKQVEKNISKSEKQISLLKQKLKILNKG